MNKKSSGPPVALKNEKKAHDALVKIIEEYSFDILGLWLETFLDLNFPSSLINVPDYSLVSKNRASRGGGVCCFRHRDIKHCICPYNMY